MEKLTRKSDEHIAAKVSIFNDITSLSDPEDVN